MNLRRINDGLWRRLELLEGGPEGFLSIRVNDLVPNRALERVDDHLAFLFREPLHSV